MELGDRYSKCFTDEEYQEFIEDSIVCDIRVSLTLGQHVPNLFKTASKYHIYLARFLVDPAFLGTGITEDDFEYTFNEYSLTYKPVSTETRTTVDITGVAVDFADIMFKLLRALSTDATKMAMVASIDGDSFNRDQHFAHLSRMAQQWRGIVGI
jgi:hypothetical protein